MDDYDPDANAWLTISTWLKDQRVTYVRQLERWQQAELPRGLKARTLREQDEAYNAAMIRAIDVVLEMVERQSEEA
jgi:hypothetical protein